MQLSFPSATSYNKIIPRWYSKWRK